MLGGVDDIVGYIVEDIVELIVRRIGCKVWMLVVGVNLEERVALSLRVDWLIDKGFEADQSSKDHFEQSIIDSTFPVVIVFLHNWG
jgi:hypothetical protein